MNEEAVNRCQPDAPATSSGTQSEGSSFRYEDSVLDLEIVAPFLSVNSSQSCPAKKIREFFCMFCSLFMRLLCHSCYYYTARESNLVHVLKFKFWYIL